MLLISHRGNLNGPDTTNENSPDYVWAALKAGYDVEIDVWLHNSTFYLGHDEPTYEVPFSFLWRGNFWCHAKNIGALQYLTEQGIHCFWHQEDDVTLTTRKYLWTYPGKPLATSRAIAVMPERVPEWDVSNAWGICTDYVGNK